MELNVGFRMALRLDPVAEGAGGFSGRAGPRAFTWEARPFCGEPQKLFFSLLNLSQPKTV